MRVIKRVAIVAAVTIALPVGLAAPASAAPQKANLAWQQVCDESTTTLAGPWKRFTPMIRCTLIHKNRRR